MSNPKSPYESVALTYDEADVIRKQPGWSHYAEIHTTRGDPNIYWNELTGEILYENGDESNLQRLIKQP